MKYLILLLFIAGFGLIIYGFTLPESDLADKFKGSGTLLIFLVAMPIFIFHAAKGKKMKDYMLTEDNIRKMQGKKTKNSDNQ